MCYHTLKLSNIRMKENPKDLEKVNNIMYEEEIVYDGGATVYHLLPYLKDQIGFDELRSRVKVDLGNLKVASYYGCLLLRPQDISIDPSMENPTIMSEFVEALGAVPVAFPHSTECCGGYLTVTEKALVAERSYEIVESARNAGADLLLTSCPLCQFNLDDRQKEITRNHTDFEPMPVLYFTQLLAVALGLDEKAVRFDLNWVDPSIALGAYVRE
jgi:heterodisulfide reductase subunit B